MLKYKDKKWYQLWGPCRESADLPMKTADPSSLLRFFLLFLYLSLSVMSRDCHSRSAQRHTALPRAEELRKDRGDRRGRNGTGETHQDGISFPSRGSWVSSPDLVLGEEAHHRCCPCLIPSSATLSFSLPFCLQRDYGKDILGNERFKI